MFCYNQNFYFYQMTLTNFERLIQLADNVFAVKNDPDQLDVNQEVLDRLRQIHPSTVSQYDDGNGPVAWILLFPTTLDLMNLFLENNISEKEMFCLTPLDSKYETVYLCSALVLEEYRRKGITRQLALKAIENIRKDHPIGALFVWAFSSEGDLVAGKIAELTGMPLFKRLK